MNLKRPTPRHIIIKMSKVKDKENLKSGKREKVTYKRAPGRLSADLLIEALQDKRNWHSLAFKE